MAGTPMLILNSAEAVDDLFVAKAVIYSDRSVGSSFLKKSYFNPHRPHLPMVGDLYVQSFNIVWCDDSNDDISADLAGTSPWRYIPTVKDGEVSSSFINGKEVSLTTITQHQERYSLSNFLPPTWKHIKNHA